MFLNPIMLAGLGAAVIPLVLHLFSKARHETVQWGATMFLDSVESPQRHGDRIKQAILLLIRTSIIVLIALALARPVLRPQSAGSAEGSRLHTVIILDRSASMGFEENGRTRIAEAKQAAINVLSNLRRGDEVSLLFMGEANDDRPAEPAEPTTDLQAVASRISALVPAAGRANVAAALEQAQTLLLRDRSTGHEVYLICDNQAIGWQDVDDVAANAWRQMQRQLESEARCFVISLGGEESDNVAVDSITVPGPPVVRNMPAEVDVLIRNFGPVPRTQLPISIVADNREIAQTSVNLAPDSSITARIPVRFPTAGSIVLSARTTSTGLRGDDGADLAIDILEPLRVLIISGDAGRRGSADVQRLALAPHATSNQAGVDPAIVRVVDEDSSAAISMELDDVVVLSNVARLSGDDVSQLEQFVYGGGGLLIAPGDRTDVSQYNEELYRDGEGCLPASLRSSAAPSMATTLKTIDSDHPIFQFLLAHQNELPKVQVARWLDLEDRPAEARVLATFANGKPFLIERPYGRGRVLLATTSLNAEWNALPTTELYLPFLQSVIRYLGSGALPPRNLKPRDPIELVFDYRPTELSAQLTMPSGQQRTIPVVQSGARWTVTFRETERPGRYSIGIRGDTLRVNYIVTGPRDQSDPHPLSPQRWAWLQDSLGFQRVEPETSAMAGAITAARTGRELYLPLLLGAIALALCETSLTRHWSHQS